MLCCWLLQVMDRVWELQPKLWQTAFGPNGGSAATSDVTTLLVRLGDHSENWGSTPKFPTQRTLSNYEMSALQLHRIRALPHLTYTTAIAATKWQIESADVH